MMASSPHFFRLTSVSRIMLTVLAALLPGTAVAVWLFGCAVLLQIGLATTTALAAEALVLRWRGLPVRPYLADGSAVVTAWLIALAFPPLGVWWLVVVGTLFAIVVAKHLYGGLGNNPFNPAMVAYALMIVSFPAQMSQWAAPLLSLDSLQQLQWVFWRELPTGMALDAISSATPLDYLKTQLMNGQTVPQLLADSTHFSVLAGVGVEWLAVAWLLGGLFLLQQRIMTWHAPVALLLAVAALSGVMHLIDPLRYAPPVVHLFSGATMFAAWFIVTDPVSGSTTPKGKLIFAAGVGILLYVIRVWGSFPDGVAFAVLIMNIAVPFIDRYTRPPVFGQQHKKITTKAAKS